MTDALHTERATLCLPRAVDATALSEPSGASLVRAQRLVARMTRMTAPSRPHARTAMRVEAARRSSPASTRPGPVAPRPPPSPPSSRAGTSTSTSPARPGPHRDGVIATRAMHGVASRALASGVGPLGGLLSGASGIAASVQGCR